LLLNSHTAYLSHQLLRHILAGIMRW